jgi:hypothetical protein
MQRKQVYSIQDRYDYVGTHAHALPQVKMAEILKMGNLPKIPPLLSFGAS